LALVHRKSLVAPLPSRLRNNLKLVRTGTPAILVKASREAFESSFRQALRNGQFQFTDCSNGGPETQYFGDGFRCNHANFLSAHYSSSVSSCEPEKHCSRRKELVFPQQQRDGSGSKYHQKYHQESHEGRITVNKSAAFSGDTLVIL